jgi:histone H3/H4
MGRESPKYLEKQSKKESEIEASDKSRREADAGALTRIEAHLSRHIAGILSLHAPVQHTAETTEETNEEYEKMARLKYEARVKVMRMKRELAMKKADEKAQEEMEQHINNDVGSILSSVVPGPGGVKANAGHDSEAPAQDHPKSHPTQALETVPASHNLMKEVKKYIDMEIAKRVHSVAPTSAATPTSVRTQGDAAEELQKLRAYILSGNFQKAVKLASSQDRKTAADEKGASASKVGPLNPSKVKSFNALFGKLVKG